MVNTRIYLKNKFQGRHVPSPAACLMVTGLVRSRKFQSKAPPFWKRMPSPTQVSASIIDQHQQCLADISMSSFTRWGWGGVLTLAKLGFWNIPELFNFRENIIQWIFFHQRLAKIINNHHPTTISNTAYNHKDSLENTWPQPRLNENDHNSSGFHDFFSALQCRLECETGFVAQRTPLITCVNGEYAKECHYWKIRSSEMFLEVEFLRENISGRVTSKFLKDTIWWINSEIYHIKIYNKFPLKI